VWLLDKYPERALAISQQGVLIEVGSESRSVATHVTADASDIGSADLLILCVKSYDTAAAMETARPLLTDQTILVSMQNGADNGKKVADVASADRVMCCTTAHGSTNLGSGHIRHAGTGPTEIAPFLSGNDAVARTVADSLSLAGIDTSASRDANRMIWSKLVINAAINPVAALADVKNGQLLENKELRAQMGRVALEAAVVASAVGIDLDYDDPVARTEEVCRATADNCSSMLQDVRMKRQTEIESITGHIVSEAHANNVRVPANEDLLARMRQFNIINRTKSPETE
jgi:2-dehydropantoate 2-reductase